MPETTPAWTLEPPFCRHLRSKDLYLNRTFPPSGLEESEGTPCWCMKTQQNLGPDGDLVDRTACMPDRTCYEADEI